MKQKGFPIDRALTVLRKESRKWNAPVTSLMAARGAKPFHVLVSAMLSAQTKDQVTTVVSERLFRIVKKPSDFAHLSIPEIQKLIYPVSFYKTKARHLKALSRMLITDFGGKVPDSIEEIVKLPGVGRKTANLVMTDVFHKPAICVDTHVNRITNRFGYVRTTTPHQTEIALRAKLPRKWWIRINPILVAFGQTICNPISPKCSQCPIRQLCPRIGVKRSR